MALFSALLLLAIVPGPSVLVVSARTLSGGTRSGLATAAGVLSSDYVFIIVAVLGLSALAELMGQAFQWVKLLGALYLVYLGIKILRRPPAAQLPCKDAAPTSLLKDFSAGFLVTMANPKAILFYVSFFPAFVNVTQLGLLDVALILLIATLVLGGVLLVYVVLIQKSRDRLASAHSRRAKTLSGSVLIASGCWIALRNQ